VGGASKAIVISDAAVGDIYRWMWATRFGRRKETLWRLQNLDVTKPPRAMYYLHKIAGQVQDGRFAPWFGG